MRGKKTVWRSARSGRCAADQAHRTAQAHAHTVRIGGQRLAKRGDGGRDDLCRLVAQPTVHGADFTYVQVRDKLDVKFEDIGEQRLKNIQRPVRVYRLDDGGESEFPQPNLRHQEKLSIAVLPFQNLSGDPAQDYFSDGITEDIITELSRPRKCRYRPALKCFPDGRRC
jgi:hypothetical protein